MLDSLHRRPRGGAQLARVLSRLTRGAVPAGPAGGPIVDSLLAYDDTGYAAHAGPVTRALLARLDAGDRAEVVRSLDAGTRAIWDGAEPAKRAHLTLVLGVHHRVPPVVEKTGLTAAMPPGDVHAMGRGPVAAGGDLWLADAIAAAGLQCGAGFGAGDRMLDFGCSSGRHLRVLQAWAPEVEWLGCDPNAPAIEWAAAHLPGAGFFVSPQEPPLPLEDESLAAAFAVSVWSHFGPGAAERWLEEMHRVIRPGGLLILTAQGVGSLADFLRDGRIDEPYAVKTTESLLATGHAYNECFGDDGDWGVKHPEWGSAYMTLEWLAERSSPEWSVGLYEPGRVDGNQDLIVLRRSPARDRAEA